MTDPLEDVDEVPVLLAGGGLVGLSTAMFLAQHGVASLAVEQLSGGSADLVRRCPRAPGWLCRLARRQHGRRSGARALERPDKRPDEPDEIVEPGEGGHARMSTGPRRPVS
jgi:glycine/D-amino acid oxidase-like deaminating enzyme